MFDQRGHVHITPEGLYDYVCCVCYFVYDTTDQQTFMFKLVDSLTWAIMKIQID